MAEKTTTIKLNRATKERLEHMREQESETYDFLINKALNILNLCRKSPAVSYRILRDIERSKKRNKLISSSESKPTYAPAKI
jgi:predicted transcriptional regulator